MKSWRIGQRLGIGFGVGVVFLIAIGWLSLRGMAVMNASLQTIANERSVVVGLTNEVLQLSIDNARITMQLFMVSAPAEEKLLAQNKENQRLIGVGVERLEKLLSTEKEKALFNDVKTLRTPYLDSRAEMKKLLTAGHRDAAIAMANDDMIPKLTAYRASWNRFLAAQNDSLKAAVSEGTARYRSTRALALFLMVLAALAASVIGVAVTRRITTPILDLTRTVQRVSSERDYSLRTARSTSDELGLLADGFNDMLGKIQEQNVALQEAHDSLEEKVKERTHDLESAHARFRVTFEQAAVGIAHVGTDGRWLRVNQKLCQMLGYSHEELLARTSQEITHPVDLEADMENVRRMLAGEIQAYTMEKRYIRKDGTAAWIALTVSLTRDAEGRPKYFISVIEDIEPRKRAEAERTHLAEIVEQASEDVMMTDVAGSITYVNPAFERISGYSRGEVLGKNSRFLKSGRRDQKFYTELWQTITGGGVWSGHFINKRKDSTLVEEEGTIFPLRDDGGQIVSYVAIKRDVTQEVRLKEQLEQAQKMETVGRLAGGVAHDFNNLLTVISGNTDLLLSDSPADDPRRGRLTDIHDAGERAASLTRQLLAFSRKQILEPKLVDVHETIMGIERMLCRLIGEDVDLSTDLAANPSWVKVDPGQLEQVIMNLAVNARDAMPRGGRLTIRTRTLEPVDLEETEGRQPRPKVAISVSDTGTGISPDARIHLFEPFFTTKGVGKGTGLGLATVYGIVKQSGGDISVESEPGKGATFTVILPSNSAQGRPGDSGVSLRRLLHGTETVLVVEDEDAVRRIVRIALESRGYRVIEARRGLEALELARTHADEIHLVVTDVVMPEMSGRELAERLRSEQPGLRVLYMSGYTDDAVMRHGIVGSEVAFLQKPFSPLALARKVREVLDAVSPER